MLPQNICSNIRFGTGRKTDPATLKKKAPKGAFWCLVPEAGVEPAT